MTKKTVKKKKKIIFLVCVNDKEHSRTALKFACARAIATGGEVALISVVDPVDYQTIFSVADVIREERVAEAKKLLVDLSQEVQASFGIKPKQWVREGLIADAICEAVTENKVSFLVLGVAADGSSNKGGLLTSLVEMIGARYHVPLLIVPGNLNDEQIDMLS